MCWVRFVLLQADERAAAHRDVLDRCIQLRLECVAVTGPAFCEAAYSLPASSAQVLAADDTEVCRENHGPYISRVVAAASYGDRTGGVHAQSLVQLLQPVIRSGDLVRPTTESRCCLAELAEG